MELVHICMASMSGEDFEKSDRRVRRQELAPSFEPSVLQSGSLINQPYGQILTLGLFRWRELVGVMPEVRSRM